MQDHKLILHNCFAFFLKSEASLWRDIVFRSFALILELTTNLYLQLLTSQVRFLHGRVCFYTEL